MSNFTKAKEIEAKNGWWFQKMAFINNCLWIPYDSGIDIYSTECDHVHTISAKAMGNVRSVAAVDEEVVVATSNGLHLFDRQGRLLYGREYHGIQLYLFL